MTLCRPILLEIAKQANQQVVVPQGFAPIARLIPLVRIPSDLHSSRAVDRCCLRAESDGVAAQWGDLLPSVAALQP